MHQFIPIKNQTKQMKKVFALLTAFVFVGLVACGPSAEDKAKEAAETQRLADSTANALLQEASNAAAPDSSSAAGAPDSTAH